MTSGLDATYGRFVALAALARCTMREREAASRHSRIAGALFALAASAASPSSIAADDPPDTSKVKDIATFVECLNKIKTKGSAADAVVCLPPGCKVTLTMSGTSTQAACTLGTCQLPRVILDCPDPTNKAKNKKRLRPSFLLCPIDSKGRANKDFGLDRIELAEDGEGVDVSMDRRAPAA